MPDSRNILRREVWSPLSGTAPSRLWTGKAVTLPTAAAQYRFMELTIPGDGTTVDDAHYRCQELRDGTFKWVPMDRPLRDVLANRPSADNWRGRFFILDGGAVSGGDRVQFCGQKADNSWDFIRMIDFP